MFITAEVKNIGKAPSPQNLNVGLINALDTNGEIWGKGNGVWGNGIGLESVEPGETVTVTFPIYYLVNEPSYMEGKHTFDLKVNRGNWIEESDLKNNGYKKLLEITIPEGYCENHPG
ncbi:CARDB domain protein [Leptospira weilii str. Ecochallenge]|nr:CARDB domain protein [Leptospira weilii str. 2006001855]EMY15351.1 CARDB domain protein [Leptospira weilii str. Ecochallenge]